MGQKYIAYPIWENEEVSQNYRNCIITLYNQTDTDLVAPDISFFINAGQTASVNSGFTFSGSGPHISGKLDSWMNTVDAGKNVQFSIGINQRAPGDITLLPYDFTVDNEDANVPIDDTKPPSVPANVIATAGAITINLSWGPPTGDTMVAGYQVSYLETENTLQEEPVVVKTSIPSVALTNLQSDTMYQVQIAAYDLSGNSSDWSEAQSITTTALPLMPVVVHF